jgi:hypothetical protein
MQGNFAEIMQCYQSDESFYGTRNTVGISRVKQASEPSGTGLYIIHSIKQQGYWNLKKKVHGNAVPPLL